MYKLVGINSEISWNSLDELQKDLSKLVCKDCLEASNTLTQLLSSGCGQSFVIVRCGEALSTSELNKLYEEECEEMYGY